MMTEIINKQKEYFARISKTVEDLLCIWDGAGHKDFYGKNKRTYLESKRLNYGQLITDRLRFNGREIILDPSFKDWNLNYIDGIKIKNFLDKGGIPYDLIYTGGKGIRFSIFLKQSLTQQEIFALYVYLCSRIDIKWETNGVPENKQKNHLLGVAGKIGSYKSVASWIEEIPKERPRFNFANFKFNPNVKDWNIPKSFIGEAKEITKLIPRTVVEKTYSKFRYRKPLLILKWQT